MLDLACESSARQMIHMKCQALFALKEIKKIIVCYVYKFTIINFAVNVQTDRAVAV